MVPEIKCTWKYLKNISNTFVKDVHLKEIKNMCICIWNTIELNTLKSIWPQVWLQYMSKNNYMLSLKTKLATVMLLKYMMVFVKKL